MTEVFSVVGLGVWPFFTPPKSRKPHYFNQKNRSRRCPPGLKNPHPSTMRSLSMTRDQYLFPRRLSRRDFLQMAGAGAAGLALAGNLAAAEKPVRIGSGKSTYTLDSAWGTLPQGMKYGLGCAVVVDAKDRVF